MSKKTNEDMAGIVSEPKGAIPDVKPAKSLWPRPHETVRVEPVLDPPREEAPDLAPPVMSPVEPVAEFSAGPEEGYREPELTAPQDEAPEETIAPSVPDIEETVSEAIIEDDLEPELPPEEQSAAEPEIPAPELTEEEPVLSAAPEPISMPSREHRHVSVLDIADREPPALDDPGESRTGKFVAMAAGIVVALAIGAVGLVYGTSALGLKFGGSTSGDGDTTASTSTAPTPIANPEDVKAMEERVAALQAELERLRQEKEKTAAAGSASENQPESPSANPPVASIPGPTPAPNAINAPAPSPAPTPAPAPQAAAPAPVSEPTPPASSSNSAPATETARTEPTPAPPPPTAAAPPPAPKPKPPETARVDPVPAPPPYQTQPSYQQPREAATPEMPVLQNWSVRDVYNGIAVVQGGRGAPLEVEPGDELPGGNRVLAIRRLGGGWAVITERGIISGY